METTSLCPTGWHLPKGGKKNNEANNEFWTLVVNGINNGVKPNNYDDEQSPHYVGATEAGPVEKALRSYPNNFLYSGDFEGSYATSRGYSGRGYYLSSTAGSLSLELLPDTTWPGNATYSSYRGHSVRCVAGS